MPSRLRVLAFLLLVTPFASAQNPAPTAAFVVHAERPPKSSNWSLRSTAIAPTSVLAVTPDRQAVLALVPQQNPHWSLSMLTGWETGTPQERVLSFDGYVARNRLDHITGAMNPTPDGKAVLIRVLVFHLATNTREVVVLMVDLETFKVVWRNESVDPLIANSRWRFSDEGVLIAAEGPPPSSTPKQIYDWSDVITLNPASLGEHEAAEISLPDLKASLPCRYRVQAPRDAVVETESCTDLLTAAGVTSAARLPGSPVGQRVENLAGSLCDFMSVSEGGLLALYKCRTGTTANNGQFYTTGREVKVLHVADGSVALAIHEPESEYVVAGLATAGGHDYLVRLHDGIKFEAYLLQ